MMTITRRTTFLLMLLSLWGATPPTARAATQPAGDPCATYLTAKDVVSPQAGLTFEQWADKIYGVLSQFPSGPREALMIIMYRDNQGPAAAVRTALFDRLLEKFNYTKKSELLRMKNQEVVDERITTFSFQTRVRRLMRFYGTKNPAFLTPSHLVNEIAELYSKLEDDNERKVALGLLPPLSEFPAWGKEAMTLAFEKLNLGAFEIYRLLNWRIDGRSKQFFTRDRKGKLHFIHNGHPPYFSDYQKLATVRTFVEYMKTRIVEGNNIRSTTLSSMMASDLQDMERESEALPELEVNEVDLAQERETARIKAEAEKLEAALAQLNGSAKKVEAALTQVSSAALPAWMSLPNTDVLAPETPAKLTEADRTAFNRYFTALNASNLERAQVIEVLKHLLIAKGNALLVGPGGTNKTRLIRQFLGNILVDGKPSYAEVGFSQESTSDDVKGPYDPKALLEDGKYERRYDEGVFTKKFVAFDEVDKVRPKLYPTLFTFLADRLDAAGSRMVAADSELVIGTANKFVSQLYLNMLPQEVQPYIDRYDYVVFIPGELETIESSLKLSEDIEFKATLDMQVVEKVRELQKQVIIPRSVKLMANLLFHSLRDKTLQHQKEEEEQHAQASRQAVKPPAAYKSTKIYTPRTLRKVYDKAIRAAVTARVLADPNSSLEATFEDLKQVRFFLTMTGPTLDSSNYFRKYSLDAHEESQYRFVEFEESAFEQLYSELTKAYEGTSIKELLTDLEAFDRELNSGTTAASTDLDQALKLASRLEELAKKTQSAIELPSRNHDLKPEHIFSAEHADELKGALERALKSYQTQILERQGELKFAPATQ